MIKISPFSPLFFTPSSDKYGVESRHIQLFAPEDEIVLQVLSDGGESVSGILKNIISGAISEIKFTRLEMSSTVMVYTATVSQLSTGYYSIAVNDIESDIFHVTDDQAKLECTSLIKYTSSTNRLRSDVVFVNGSEQYEFMFRVPGGFKDNDWAFQVNNEQFETSEGNIVELFAVESTAKTFTMGDSYGCPIWFGEHLNRILCCTHVHINGVRYVRKGNSTPEVTQELPGQKSYIFKVQLQGMVENVNVELPSSTEDGETESEGGGAGYVYLIKIGDNTRATDSNTYSALRITYELEKAIKKNNESLEGKYLRKDKEDVAQEIITFLKGLVSNLIQSEGFSPGEFGSGFILRNDEGGSYLEIDRLLVRRIAYFIEVIIKSLKHVGGSLVLSPASMICSKVEEYDAYYRCFFENERDGRTIRQEFVAGDQARTQEFNIKEGVSQNVGSRFYWRLVIAVGDNYIDLSKSDAAVGSVPPLAGDEIVQLGNRDDVTRQNAIILSTVGDDAPSIKQYKGINSYSTEGKERTIISSEYNMFTGRFRSSVTGEDFDTTFDQFKTEMAKIKSQTDKEYTIWFYNYTPTLQNEPASGWSDEDKIDHEYDIFYYPDAGLAWRFLEGDWKPITDQQTLRALEKAAEAQDTADGKRRNFVDVPVPPYDIGDTWSNAYYGTLYTNDNLVCITSKAEGEAFSIDDWQPTSDMNSAAKKVFESLIEQLDDRISLQVTAHNTLSTAVTALGVRIDGAEEQLTIYANKTNTLEGTVTQLGIDLDAAEAQISIYATKVGTLEGTVKQLGIDLDAAEGSISAIAGLFDKDGHLLEGSGWVTTTQYNSLYSMVQDIDGALSAKAEVRTSVQYDPNTGAVTSAIKLTADHIKLEGVATINNSFKVDTDGTTRIGGFVVSGNGLTNRNEDDTFTNDAYVVFRNDDYNCFAGIGGNILPASSGLRAVARFENHDNSDWWGFGLNCAMLVSAKGSDENIAIRLDGGSVTCLALKTRTIGHDSVTASTKPTSASYTLDRHVGSVYVSTQFNWRSSYSGSYASNTRDMNVTLPVMQSYDDGHVLKIKRGPNDGNKVYLYPNLMKYRTYGFTYAYELGIVYHDISRHNLPSGVDLPFSIDLNGASSCYVWLLNSSNEILASALRTSDGVFKMKAVLPLNGTGSSIPTKLQIQNSGCVVSCYYSGMSYQSRIDVWGQSVILCDNATYATPSSPLQINSQGDAMELVFHRDLTVTVDSVEYHGLWMQYKHPRSW